MKDSYFDKIFQKKLGDYKEIPEEAVWTRVQDSLDRKRRKRIIPIWWKLGGIAALLVLGALLYLNQDVTPAETPILTDVEEQDPAGIPPTVNIPDQEMPVVGKDTDTDRTQTIVDTSAAEQSPSSENRNNTNRFIQKEKDALSRNSSQVTVNEEVANSLRSGENLEENYTDKNLGNQQEGNLPGKIENAVALENRNLPEIQDAPSKDPVDPVLAENSGKKSIFEALEEDETEEIVHQNSSKWSVGASVAPVYFNSMGSGSPIHSSFVSNSKSGAVNLSYGMNLTYSLNKKLSIRSGLHKVEYGYNTNDVAFSATLSANANDQFKNISYSETSRNIVVESGVQPSSLADVIVANEFNAASPSRQGSMLQQFGYLEVPLELEYKIIDKKFGLNLIGGMSSLFLIDNSLSLKSEDTAFDIGSATNLNEINFSTNFGFGVHYGVMANMQLHLQPMVKFQLNTFSDTSGDFNPYSLGVYSGLTFKF